MSATGEHRLATAATLPADEITAFLAESYRAAGGSVSTLLIGPSGIGKSVGVAAAAARIAESRGLPLVHYRDAAAATLLSTDNPHFLFVDIRLIGMEPVDIQGIPREVAVRGDTFIPAARAAPDEETFSQIYDPFAWVDCLAKHPGILFLDELTNVQRPDVFSAAYQLVLDHLAGFTRFHPGVMIVAAGNAPEDSSIAQELPAPLLNRFTVIRIAPASLSAWSEWMGAQGAPWDRRILAYLASNPSDFLHASETPATMENFPTPRQWSAVARNLSAYQSEARRDAYLSGSLGSTVAAKVSAFLRADLPPLDALMENPASFSGLTLDGQYLAAAAVAEWIERTVQDIVGSDTIPTDRMRELISPIGEQIALALPLLQEMARISEEYLMVAIGGIAGASVRLAATAALFPIASDEFTETLARIAQACAAIGGAF